MKNVSFKNVFIGFIAGLLLIFISFPVQADDWPERPITLQVPYPPGGATDFQTRIVTMLAEKYIGQPINVLNRPGAGGRVGWNYAVTDAPKDGYFMTVYNLPHFIAQSVVFDTKYDYTTFEPLANWGADPAVLYVREDSVFDSVQEIVEYAKENPGKVTCGGAGLYVGHHIAKMQFEKAADIRLTYIPGASGYEMPIQAVLKGEVDIGFNNLSDCARAGDQVKIFAIAALERHNFLPEVKTFKELGYEDVDNTSLNYRGIAFPKGVEISQEKIKEIANDVYEMFNDDKTKAKMKDTHSPMKIMNREEVLDMYKKRHEYLSKLYADVKDE